MNEAVKELIGQKVQVWSNSAQQGYTDSGTLYAFDDPWLLLRADDGSLLCFPIYNVRLVKCAARSKTDTHLAPS